MSSEEGAALWTEHVLKAMAEVRSQSGVNKDNFSSEQNADLDRLTSAGAALEALVGGGDDSPDNHDIRNVLGAIRGYAELPGTGITV